MTLPIYHLFLFIYFILGIQSVDANFHDFKVKIQKIWTDQKEYEYLFNVVPIEQAMTLTIYQANINPNVPINGNLAAAEENGNTYISYVFLIPTNWAESLLELRITLKQSGQIILRRFTLRRLDPQRIFIPNEKDRFIFLNEIGISILTEGKQISQLMEIKLEEMFMHMNMDDPFSTNGIGHAIDSVKIRKEICKKQGAAIVQLLRANFDESYATFFIAQMFRENRWHFIHLMVSHLQIVKQYVVHHQLHDKYHVIGKAIMDLDNELKFYGNERFGEQGGGRKRAFV